MVLVKAARPSKRPRESSSPSPSASGSGSSDGDTADRQALLEAYEARQRAFLADAAPTLLSKSKEREEASSKPKAIWEMDMDDLEDDEDSSSSSSSSSSSDGEVEPLSKGDIRQAKAPQTVVFADPSRSSSQAGAATTSFGDVRQFMSTKVKDTQKRYSMADAANEKRSQKLNKKRKAEAAMDEEEAEEEAHLQTLDSSLSKLIKPLTSNDKAGSPLPQLLASLPLEPTKPKKGLTPLPSNAPRKMRKGQSAVNLERAKKRDAEAGLLPGQKGREALSLKEKRKKLGDDKRERGMRSAFGTMKGGQLKLSAADIRQATYDPNERRRSKKKGGKKR